VREQKKQEATFQLGMMEKQVNTIAELFDQAMQL